MAQLGGYLPPNMRGALALIPVPQKLSVVVDAWERGRRIGSSRSFSPAVSLTSEAGRCSAIACLACLGFTPSTK